MFWPAQHIGITPQRTNAKVSIPKAIITEKYSGKCRSHSVTTQVPKTLHATIDQTPKLTIKIRASGLSSFSGVRNWQHQISQAVTSQIQPIR
jgi:hypothetical protein